MTDILLRLDNAHSCVERGLDLDRDMRFSVNGNGPGSSTSFSIERDIFWEAMREIVCLRKAMKEACDLLAERAQGSPARSAGHNARVRMESALSVSSQERA